LKPAGWAWQPTGENFGKWWKRQNTEARNVYLRAMEVRLTFGNPAGIVAWHVYFEHLELFEEHLKFGKSATEVVRHLGRDARSAAQRPESALSQDAEGLRSL
jgi:site-specific DNA recombinase